MCLGIPGKIIAITDAAGLMGLAEISGVRREVSLAPVAVGPLEALVGQWALIHVGFAMAIIDADEAAKTLQALADLGEAQETLEQLAAAERALA
jgi:hydrogenase expression/formation protein HypC